MANEISDQISKEIADQNPKVGTTAEILKKKKTNRHTEGNPKEIAIPRSKGKTADIPNGNLKEFPKISLHIYPKKFPKWLTTKHHLEIHEVIIRDLF